MGYSPALLGVSPLGRNVCPTYTAALGPSLSAESLTSPGQGATFGPSSSWPQQKDCSGCGHTMGLCLAQTKNRILRTFGFHRTSGAALDKLGLKNHGDIGNPVACALFFFISSYAKTLVRMCLTCIKPKCLNIR